MKAVTTFKKNVVSVLAVLILIAFPAAAQSFGFGDAGAAEKEAATESDASTPSAATGATVGGSINFYGTGFLSDFSDPANATVWNGSTGTLNFSAKGSKAEAAFKLKISGDILTSDPAKLIDEAYIRMFIGPLELEGGLLKVSWGKADSQSVLDVLNPFDLTDLTVTDTRERKIAQPMLHLSAAIGSASKAEIAFLPGFQASSVAWEGKWMPALVGTYKSTLGITDIDTATSVISFPTTNTLSYAQGGARFTTTVGSVDLGAQYFYGLLPTMAVSPAAVAAYLTAAGYHAAAPLVYPAPNAIPVYYNRYHQAGLDVATELFGFNLRAEAAANITADTSGDDPNTYNPTAAWTLGFDRDLLAGINLNLQGSGTIRLMNDKVTSALDLEKTSDAVKTKITAVLSQKLFKDTLEWQVAGIYGIEKNDFFVYPSVGYIVGDARLDLTVGIFGGDRSGDLGQFTDSNYVSLSLTYSF
ncbi:MAG: hypothetical protein WCT14_18395 [Treponemataceae bacterium]